MDFADGEGKLEKFAARFKTAELAAEFHQAFEKAKEITATATTTISASNPEPTKPVSTEPIKGFGNQFAPKSGAWTCEACYVSNVPESNVCSACETPRPVVQIWEAKKDNMLILDHECSTSSGIKFKWQIAKI